MIVKFSPVACGDAPHGIVDDRMKKDFIKPIAQGLCVV